MLISIFHQSCEKLADAIKHSDISGTSEVLIIHFKWDGIIAQSTAFFASTHEHHTYMLHTCFICKWYFLSFLMCAFPPLSVLLLPHWDMGKLLLGRRRVSQGWQKHFSFDQAKYSAGIMHSCRGCKTADYPRKALKNFDGSLVRCVWKMCL